MKKHFVMSLVTVAGWLFFYLLGIHFDYFLNETFFHKILILWLTMFSILPLFTFIVVSFLDGDVFRNSLWFSLYASFGVFLLDLIFVGIIHQNGLGFLKTHWLQTIGYAEAVVIIPVTGLSIKRVISRKMS